MVDAPAAACEMCAMASSGHSVVRDGFGRVISAMDAPDCCSTRQVLQQVPPSVLARADAIPGPVLVPVFHVRIARESVFDGRSSEARPVGHSPPPLARQGQSTYLRNSSFLI